jgi:hypothetical protein
MRITIEQPGGPRQGVSPSDGIGNESTLIKSLILTLAAESNYCVDEVTLRVNLFGCDPTRLVEVAKAIAHYENGELAGAS